MSGYQAICTTCGWESPQVFRTEQAAIDDGADHEVAAAEPELDKHHETEVRH